jgi:hypothetical protein
MEDEVLIEGQRFADWRKVQICFSNTLQSLIFYGPEQTSSRLLVAK